MGGRGSQARTKNGSAGKKTTKRLNSVDSHVMCQSRPRNPYPPAIHAGAFDPTPFLGKRVLKDFLDEFIGEMR